MYKTIEPPSVLTLELLESLDSLNDSELERLMLTVDESLWPSYLGQLTKYRIQKTKDEKLWSVLHHFSPHKPWPKQNLFLQLECKEALYGGAAGGGKSDALLMAALQYVHVPRYSALILRKDSARLRLSGGLIPRSMEWLHGRAEWNGTDRRWTFSNGASIQFGYLQHAEDKYRYGSSEFQFIGFDELTEFAEEDYTFMFSRLRKTTDMNVPYRMRGASNPGGKGHEWVKSRFVGDDAITDLKNDSLGDVYWKETRGERRAFVPAKIRDNPAVDPNEYIANLLHLSPVFRDRLMNGDWTVMPEGLIKPHWLRYYTTTDMLTHLNVSRLDREGNIIHTNEILHTVDTRTCKRFVTCDTAGGSKQITAQKKGKNPSWTVAGIWDTFRLGGYPILICRHVWRAQVGFTDVRDKLTEIYELWRPSSILVEDKTMGPDLVDLLQRRLPIRTVPTGNQDKVTRAVPLLNMMEQGRVYLPAYESSWRQTLETEYLSWQGIDDETNDQIDMSAYAAIEAGGTNVFGETVKLDIGIKEMANPIPTVGGVLGKVKTKWW